MDWRNLQSPNLSPQKSSSSELKSQSRSIETPISKQSSLKKQNVSPTKAQHPNLQNHNFQQLMNTYRVKNNILSKYFTLQPLKNKQNVTQKQILNDPVVFEEWDEKKSNKQSELKEPLNILEKQIEDVKQILKKESFNKAQNVPISTVINDLKLIQSRIQKQDQVLEQKIQTKMKQMKNIQNQLGNFFFERRLDQP